MLLNNRREKYFTVFAILLLVLVIASFGNISTHTFLHWDDITYVIYNQYLRPFSIQNLINIFLNFTSANWHPITWLSYMINFSMTGESAIYFKVTNISIHFFNSLLVFYLAYILQYIAKYPYLTEIKSPYNSQDTEILVASAIATLLFSVHPQHLESVTWISGRKDLLCTFFYLLAVIAYLHMQYSGDRKKWTNLVSISFVCSLMSKSMAVTFPVVITLLDIYPLTRIKCENSLMQYFVKLLHKKVMYIVLSSTVVAITIISQKANMASVNDYGIMFRLSNATINYFYYIYSIISPNLILPYHPLDKPETLPNLFSILLIFLFIFITVASSILFIKKNVKWPLVLFSTYLFMLLPAIGLIQVGHAARADRYAYLSSVGFYIALGIGISLLLRRFNKYRWLTAAIHVSLAVIILFLGSITYNMNKVWANDKLIWEYMIKREPDHATTAYTNLGSVFFEEKEYQRAIDAYLKALAIDPKDVSVLNNLGFTYETIKDQKNAEKYYTKMIDARPESSYPYAVVGEYYYGQRNIPKSDYYYQKALQKEPSSRVALLRSSMFDYMKNDLLSAQTKIDMFLLMDSHHKLGLEIKAQISFAQKDFNTARIFSEKILKQDPNDNVARQILDKLQTKTTEATEATNH